MTNIIITVTNTVTGDVYSGTVGVYVDMASTFWKGFAFMFCIGLLALGARWVARVIGGGHESE